MQHWLGKAIGGILGLTGGWPGVLVGILLGHQLDQGAARGARARANGTAQPISRLFFEVAFEAMGRIAKSDGRVSEDEIAVARHIMSEMRLTPAQVQDAIDCFTRGKAADYDAGGRLTRLADEIAGRDVLALAFLQLQLQAAVGAGPIDPAKRGEIWDVARRLGVGRAELAQIEALVRSAARRGAAGNGAAAASLDDAYRALGVSPGASDAEIKTAYRRLMSRHHPDKLVARGLPESMAAVAAQKTREIRAAYDAIKAARQLK